MNEKPTVLRVCLNEDGTFLVYPWFKNDGDYSITPLDPLDALHWMTKKEIPIEIATNDPLDNSKHNYETLDPKNVTLSYI